MPWIKVHHSIRDHRKIITAAESLRIPEPQMVGHMILIWLWAVENAPDGQLRVSDAVIARVAGWTRPAKTFVDQLVAAEFLTRLDRVGCAIVNFDVHILPVIIANRNHTQRQARYRKQAQADDATDHTTDLTSRRQTLECSRCSEAVPCDAHRARHVTVT